MIIPCVGGALERNALATQSVYNIDRVTSLGVIAPMRNALKRHACHPAEAFLYQMTTSAA